MMTATAARLCRVVWRLIAGVTSTHFVPVYLQVSKCLYQTCFAEQLHLIQHFQVADWLIAIVMFTQRC